MTKRLRKLSAARPRTELITEWQFGPGAVPPPAPPKAGAPAPEEDPAKKPVAAPTADEADAKVSSAISAIKVAIDAAIAAQGEDPDSDDPKDKAIAAGLTALQNQLAELEKAQAEDADDNPAPDKPAADAGDEPAAPPATPPAGGDATAHRFAAQDAPTTPVDEEGNVSATHKCANADCTHYASAHANTDQGDNTGACGMRDCECAAMEVDAKHGADADDPDAGDGGGPNNDGGTDPSDPANTIGDQTGAAQRGSFAGGPDGSPAPADAPAPAPTEDPEAPALNKPPVIAGSENMGPAFTIPVAIIEGQPTGDGREIADEALDWRVPPLPLMGLATETHDPNGMDLNDPAVICGRIDSFERVPGEGSTQVIMARGFYLPNDDGMYFADLNEAMGRLGISADIAVEAQQVSVEDIDESGWPTEMSEVLTKGTIMGLTVCPYAAFEGAYIVLGDGTDAPEAKAMPEAPPIPAMVAAGGQLLHFLTYEECEPCSSGIEVLAASGGPERPPRAWFENPNFTAGDGRLQEILEKRGTRALGGKYACPITVTDEGRIFGHLAPFGVCHTASSGQCIMAPRSKVDYAHYKRGQHVITAEGDAVRVGVITAGTGHASQRSGLSAGAAMAHYDNTALQCADVAIGEDEYGIWVAGALRPDATPEQIRTLRASSLSGDWRNMGGNLELVAALAVNQPGFPMAVVASGRIESLVASGSAVMYRLGNPTPDIETPAELGDVTLRRALGPLLGQAKDMAKERIGRLVS